MWWSRRWNHSQKQTCCKTLENEVALEIDVWNEIIVQTNKESEKSVEDEWTYIQWFEMSV